MEQEPQTLRGSFVDAEKKRGEIGSASNANSAAFHEKLSKTVASYERCLRIADEVSLFSPNETLDDVSSTDLPYFLISFHRAELLQKVQQQDRTSLLRKASTAYDAFLKLLDQYDILSRNDSRLLEHWRESPEKFSTAPSTDAARRRETKIARFKLEKELKQKLEA